jgi:hypothetical protein
LIEAAVLSGKRAGSSTRDAGHLMGAERGFIGSLSLRDIVGLSLRDIVGLSLRDIDTFSLREGGMLRHGRMMVRACRRARRRLGVDTHGRGRFHGGPFLRSLRRISRHIGIEMIFDEIRRRAGALLCSLRCIGRGKRITTALDRICFRVGALAWLAHEIGGKLNGMRRFS